MKFLAVAATAALAGSAQADISHKHIPKNLPKQLKYSLRCLYESGNQIKCKGDEGLADCVCSSTNIDLAYNGSASCIEKCDIDKKIVDAIHKFAHSTCKNLKDDKQKSGGKADAE